MSARMHKSLTLAQKYQVVKQLASGRSSNDIETEFGITQSTVSRLKTNREHIIHEFETGLQCAFYNPDLWLNLGGTFFNANQYDSARHCWQTVQVLNPNYPNLANYMAMLPKQTSN